MDWLRSCYSTKIRPWRDDPTEVDIVWSFVDDRPFYRGRSVFRSLNWVDPKEVADAPGEIYDRPRPWRDGSLPFGPMPIHFCGTADQFMGQDPAPGPPPPRAPNGALACCYPGGFVEVMGAGGGEQGGEAAQNLMAVIRPEGGQEQGGESDIRAFERMHPVGGQEQGGVTPMGLVYRMDATGGQNQAGVSPMGVVYTMPATGGQEQGGASSMVAVQGYPFSISQGNSVEAPGGIAFAFGPFFPIGAYQTQKQEADATL